MGVQEEKCRVVGRNCLFLAEKIKYFLFTRTNEPTFALLLTRTGYELCKGNFSLHHINLIVHATKLLKPHSALVFFVLKKGAEPRCRKTRCSFEVQRRYCWYGDGETVSLLIPIHIFVR